MARDHARIYCSIWSDPEFRELPATAQGMYFTLTSQPRLSYCGVLDYLPTRLAKLSKGASVRSVNAAVGVLERHQFVVVDSETGELLIRTFVRHDGLLDSPNVTKAMAKAYETVLSEPILAALRGELRRAYEDSPDLKGWNALRNSSPDLFAMVSRNPSRKGSSNG